MISVVFGFGAVKSVNLVDLEDKHMIEELFVHSEEKVVEFE